MFLVFGGREHALDDTLLQYLHTHNAHTHTLSFSSLESSREMRHTKDKHKIQNKTRLDY